MYLTLTEFPHIQLKDKDTDRGTLSKQGLLQQSFKINNTSHLFVPTKTNINFLSNTGYSNIKYNGFLLEILFHGINFNSKRIRYRRPKYFIDVHKSELHIYNELSANTFKSRIHKRRLIFFSYDRHLLYYIEKTIKAIKLPDSYTGKGLFSRNDQYILKKGKKDKKR